MCSTAPVIFSTTFRKRHKKRPQKEILTGFQASLEQKNSNQRTTAARSLWSGSEWIIQMRECAIGTNNHREKPQEFFQFIGRGGFEINISIKCKSILLTPQWHNQKDAAHSHSLNSPCAPLKHVTEQQLPLPPPPLLRAALLLLLLLLHSISSDLQTGARASESRGGRCGLRYQRERGVVTIIIIQCVLPRC
jgi:hypothetical protein